MPSRIFWFIFLFFLGMSGRVVSSCFQVLFVWSYLVLVWGRMVICYFGFGFACFFLLFALFNTLDLYCCFTFCYPLTQYARDLTVGELVDTPSLSPCGGLTLPSLSVSFFGIGLWYHIPLSTLYPLRHSLSFSSTR